MEYPGISDTTVHLVDPTPYSCVPPIVVELRVHWPLTATQSEVCETLSEALVDATAQIGEWYRNRQ